MKSEKSFEEALKRLQEIVTRLESGEETLDESIKLFEEGAKLTGLCYKQLNRAEQTVTTFSKLMEASEENDD